MHGGHAHGHEGLSGSGQHRWRLAVAMGLAGGYFVVQFTAALLTGSLALLSDAGHMFTDVIGLGMAFAAATVAASAIPAGTRSFGLYRLEILAALGNAVLLLAVCGYILYESVQRLGAPEAIDAGVVLAVGVVGLGINIVSILLLRGAATESLNLRGAYLEVLADGLGSLGVIVAAVVTMATGWLAADPLFAILIALIIVPRALNLGRQALRILLQMAPPHVDLDQVRDDLARVEGVADVHDLHVWTLTSQMDVASAHLTAAADADQHRVLDEAKQVLAAGYGIQHATLQIEPAAHCGTCEPAPAW